MSIDSSSLNTGTTRESSGSAGRRARCAASCSSSAEADFALVWGLAGKVESSTDGSLHYCRPPDDFVATPEGVSR